MNKLTALGALAVIGVVIAVLAVWKTDRPPPVPRDTAATVVAPFASYVAGAGVTETGRGNVAVGTAVFGVVAELDVKVGDRVSVGDPLFRIDDRDARSRLLVARARESEAAAALAKPQHRLGFLSRLQQQDNSAVSKQSVSDLQDDVRAAQATLESAHAQVGQVELEIERSLVRAPIAGRVLQLNTRVGEYVEGGGQARPLMLLGDDRRLFLRVDIDENDAWRVLATARARAYLRNNPGLHVDLRFEYIEPVVAAKTALTGQGTERSDVRVLQVVYSFERAALPVYLGQQMDVFIEAPVKPLPAKGPG